MSQITFKSLTEVAIEHLHLLCDEVGNRRVGSAGNRAATEAVSRHMAALGWDVESPCFDCIDWDHDGADLLAGGVSLAASPSPYSLGCRVEAPLAAASTLAELEGIDARGKVLLVRGELAKEQLMPKGFPFYNPEEHQRILAALEAAAPAAIVAATTRNPELAGGVYPFPLIEDGDVDIPSVYMTAEEGERLAEHVGQRVTLESRAWRIPSQGCNVIARKEGVSGRRVVLCAHIDAKRDTPGAVDDATGIVVLMLLAELLADYQGPLGVELAAFNGEDYYSAPGQVQYLRQNAGRLNEITLVINMDVAGYHRGATAYSLYDCPAEVGDAVKGVLTPERGLTEGEPWYQGDHMIFWQQGVPAVAITSVCMSELSAQITHTPQDSPEIVDCAKLVDLALALGELMGELNRRYTEPDTQGGPHDR
jgi:aminopeptidase YwaD